MTNRLTGRGGAAQIGSVVMLFDSWEFEEDVSVAEIPAGGDEGTHREPLRYDWRIRARGFALQAPPYTQLVIPLGVAATVALRLIATHANPFTAVVGLVLRRTITHSTTEPTRIEIEVVCWSGDAADLPVMDSTPQA